ncbi:MAG: aminotransferase class I/II-fold pyridoxal phosphate-dependent enzyme [Caldithrix sp.]|nr:aminotransferase class I/II-fold pyridoxal phosphate-dependent enzyme [Caldithrix sp.]
MQPDKIWLSPPHMEGNELELVKEAFASNWIAPLGPHVDGFEEDMTRYLGGGYAAALSSGTAAVHLALIMLDVQAGDEVICQSFTFSGSANPILYQQAVPVFIDSEQETWNMDPQLLEDAIKDRIQKGKRPKAVIAVHLYGQPAKMDEIERICNDYEIPLIEDAAEALGSTYNNRKAGTFGVMSILSFNGNKIITTSGGGMLLSRDKQYVDKARFLSTQARDKAPHYEHSHIGYNYRMSNILAALGRGQLKVLPKRLQQKRDIYAYYSQRLGRYSSVTFQPEPDFGVSNRWLTALTIDPQRSGTDREQIRTALQNQNIDSRPLWKPMHMQPVFKSAPFYGSSVSEGLFADGLCLPSGTALTEQQLNRITSIIEEKLDG